MAAFSNAVRCGTDLLELDVHLSADQKVIVSHDRHLDRITGQRVDILEAAHAELPRIRKDLQLPPPFYPAHPVSVVHTGSLPCVGARYRLVAS